MKEKPNGFKMTQMGFKNDEFERENTIENVFAMMIMIDIFDRWPWHTCTQGLLCRVDSIFERLEALSKCAVAHWLGGVWAQPMLNLTS